MNAAKTWWQSVLIKKRAIEEQLATPELPVSDLIALQKSMGEIVDIAEIAEKIEAASNDIDFLESIKDEDPSAIDQIILLKSQLEEYDRTFRLLITPANDKSNKVILEVRPGTGGLEASLFAGLLVEMYKKYAQHNNWTWDVLALDVTDIGGINHITISMEGTGSYYFMEHESGVHRVQRIPKTEANGRIHTSTATVAVLPEPEEANIDIDESYIRIDVFRASGAGGQHVNKTESAIRLTYDHPELEKIVISIQEEKSQHKNKARAMKILRAKVQEQIERKLDKERAEQRKSQVGTGERSEKIRTYNFPQSRVTDHRSGVSVYNIQDDILLFPKDLVTLTNPLREDEAVS